MMNLGLGMMVAIIFFMVYLTTLPNGNFLETLQYLISPAITNRKLEFLGLKIIILPCSDPLKILKKSVMVL